MRYRKKNRVRLIRERAKIRKMTEKRNTCV